MTLIIFSINIKEHNYVRVGRFFKTHPFPCLKSLLSCKAIKKKKLLNRKSIVVLYIFPELETNDGDRKYRFVFFTPQRGCFQKSLYPNRVLNLYPNHFMCFVASMMFQRCFVIHFSIIFFFFFDKLQLTHMWFG